MNGRMTPSPTFGQRLPNILTGLRLAVVPIFVYFLIDPTPTSSLWAVVIFIVASLTDGLDGYLARKYKAESQMGKLLDPLADKILVMSALVMLASASPEPRIAAWMVVVFLGREMVVNGLRSLAAVNGIVVPASRWAKHKTAWTMLALAHLLIHEPYHVLGLLIDFQRAGTVFLWIAFVFTVWTGISYTFSLTRLVVDGPKGA